MDLRRKLFLKRDPYAIGDTGPLFLEAVRRNIAVNRDGCPEYARILADRGFSPEDIVTEADLGRIPAIPTLYLKRRRLFSVPEKKLVVRATSSGTKGSMSVVGFDRSSLVYGIMMMIRFFAFHRIISPIPVNYIVLGYQPSGLTDMGAVKTAYGTTKFAPALSREYALRASPSGYEVNIEGVRKALLRFAKSPFPVRFVGFPAYMYFLARALTENGISLRLNKRSMIMLGGGWKQFAGEEIDREEFFSLIRETLGIGRERCFEFYSAVEHPHAYVKCKNGHFHIPLYSRVVIRDAETLEPLPNGRVGLLNFITPLVTSMPLTSVITDDLAVLHDEECGCGIKAPYFDLIGRAGVSGIRTCTAQAAEILGRNGK